MSTRQHNGGPDGGLWVPLCVAAAVEVAVVPMVLLSLIVVLVVSSCSCAVLVLRWVFSVVACCAVVVDAVSSCCCGRLILSLLSLIAVRVLLMLSHLVAVLSHPVLCCSC